MLGRKRSRVDQEEHSHEERRIAPRDYNFNFIPTLQPKQNKHTPSVSTLTQRFKSRLNEYKPTKPPTTAIAPEPAFIKHQLISYTILIYMQTIFNVVVSMTVLYIFGKIMFAIKQDFRLKTQEHINVLHKERLACTNHYFINHCQDDHRIPAIEDMCNTWEACMNRDIVVAQAKVSAEAIAEIINSFVEPISYKTLFFFLTATVGVLVFSNLAFSLLKRTHKHTIAYPQ